MTGDVNPVGVDVQFALDIFRGTWGLPDSFVYTGVGRTNAGTQMLAYGFGQLRYGAGLKAINTATSKNLDAYQLIMCGVANPSATNNADQLALVNACQL